MPPAEARVSIGEKWRNAQSSATELDTAEARRLAMALAARVGGEVRSWGPAAVGPGPARRYLELLIERLQLDATVLGPALPGSVVGDRAALAVTLGIQAVLGHAPGNQVTPIEIECPCEICDVDAQVEGFQPSNRDGLAA